MSGGAPDPREPAGGDSLLSTGNWALPSNLSSPTPLRVAQIGLVAVASLLVAVLAASKHAYPLDSYFYLAKARGLSQLGLFSVPWNDGIDRKFFWGYSLALALPFKIFGEASFWIVGGVLHAWTGLVFTRIARLLGLSPELRVGTLALLLFNPLALKWATVPMSEALMVALGITAAYFAVRYRQEGKGRELLWAALFSGLSLFTRVEGMFVGMAVAALALQRVRAERRWALASLGLLLFAAPEALHLGYLAAIPGGRGLLGYLDEARAHRAELHYLSGFWSHLRAPYSLLFRFSAEPWLYARYFPGWLAGLQGLVMAAWVVALFGTLLAGFFHRGYAFWTAVALVAFALLHSVWYDAFERYDYLAYPAAALVMGWAVDASMRWASARLRTRVALGTTLLFAAIGGGYGVRASQLHGDQLSLARGGRDLRALARLANGANPGKRPVVTDLGPPLAFYLEGRVYLNDGEPGLFDDVVPTRDAGRQFLADKDVALLVSSLGRNDLEAEFSLQPNQYREIAAPGTTVFALEANPEAPP